jgi:5-methylcytosine-specific restriction endonuclease McrA
MDPSRPSPREAALVARNLVDLSRFTDEELLSGVRSIAGEERRATANLVAYLGEVEVRRLHLEAGFPSMFAFCTGELGMSENEAFRRLLAARLGRRFPVIHSLLASGALHLSALELLREHLTEENHADLLEAVSGRSKSEILAVLAARFPKADVASTIRKLPERIEPLSEARYRVEFTATAELHEKLELCRDLMSHANPGRELSVVVGRAVELLLAELTKKRLARSARRDPLRRAKPGRIASTTRRQVFERDGVRCTYVSPEGRRCDARAFLELDHVKPRALGGTDDADNLRVRCRAHNQLAAEQVFGRETVERFRHFVRQKCRRARARGAETSQARGGEGRGEHGARETRTMRAPSTMERVWSALKSMGFRDAEARQAVAHVESMHESSQTIPLELALREALLAATPHRHSGK